MLDLKKLKLDASEFSILYVEDNDVLRKSAYKVLNKIFKKVHTASDGEIGLEIFKKLSPQIVITDIEMPNMNGIEFARHIRDINSEAKVIFMSAYDTKEYLVQAIELGIVRFLKKPVSITEFAEVLDFTIHEIKKMQNSMMFHAHLKNVFNYQSSIVLMMKKTDIVFANQMFLNYFEVETIDEFLKIHTNLGNLFLKHDSFLYNDDDQNWFHEVSSNPQKIYNIKLQNKDEDFKHFILKYQNIPDNESYGILSFDDVTELNLLKLYDVKESKKDEVQKDSKAMYNLLEIIKRNNAKIELHNFYKGLSITHDAVIVDILEDTIILKTSYIQEKAIQFDRRSFITSDALPSVVACDSLSKISFEKQSVEFKNLHFAITSPVDRETMRVVPQENHTVSLHFQDIKFHGEVFIEDISLEAIKLNLEAMPAGLKKGSMVTINMVLTVDTKSLIINLEATMFRLSENKRSFSIVFTFNFKVGEKKDLAEYMTSRQMSIIREFKGKNNV